MSPLKVALISNEFPPYIFGGIGIQCYDLAYSLSKRGVHVTVFSGRSRELSVEKVGSCLQVVRMPFVNIPPRSLWFQLQNLTSLLRLLKDCTVIHIIEPRDSIILTYFKKKLRKPIITTIHEVPQKTLKAVITNFSIRSWSFGDIGYHLFEYPLDYFAFKSSLRNSDHVVTCGFQTLRGIREVYSGLVPEKISVIHNGIDFDKIEKAVTPKKNGAKIIFYGRLIISKGVLQLIRALSLVKEQFPMVRLEIIGTGPLKTKIEQLISKLDLDDNVVLRGFVPNIQLIREIPEADIVALPSLIETGPFIAALEAMACKKPVVGLDFPFTREFIRHMKNGLLAQHGSAQDLAQKILLLLSDEKLRSTLGQNAYEYVKENHNWEILVQDYIKLYESVAGKA